MGKLGKLIVFTFVFVMVVKILRFFPTILGGVLVIGFLIALCKKQKNKYIDSIKYYIQQNEARYIYKILGDEKNGN